MRQHYQIDKNFSIINRQNIEKNKKVKKNDSLFIANSLNIGYYLLTPILLGVFLGLIIDKKFNLHSVGVIAGILLGTVASFYNLIKLTKTNADN